MSVKDELYTRSFIGLEWRKSTRSRDDDPPDNCVMVGVFPDGVVAVRDSKRPDVSPLVYTPSEWAAFVTAVRDGEF